MLYIRRTIQIHANGQTLSAGEEIVTDGQNTVRRELLAVHTPDEQLQGFFPPPNGRAQLPAMQQDQDGLPSFVQAILRRLIPAANGK